MKESQYIFSKRNGEKLPTEPFSQVWGYSLTTDLIKYSIHHRNILLWNSVIIGRDRKLTSAEWYDLVYISRPDPESMSWRYTSPLSMGDTKTDSNKGHFASPKGLLNCLPVPE